MAFGVHSEVGKLRKVMVHRPGPRAHAAHPVERRGAALRRRAVGQPGQGRARRVLRGRCASAASRCSRPRRCSPRRSAKPEAQGLGRRPHPQRAAGRASAPRERAREWVESADAAAGRRLPDRRHHQGRRRAATSGWSGSRADPTSMLLPPLPNFLFQRDPSCWIYDGVTHQPDDEAGPQARDDDRGGDLPVPPDVRGRAVPDLARRRRRGLGPRATSRAATCSRSATAR